MSGYKASDSKYKSGSSRPSTTVARSNDAGKVTAKVGVTQDNTAAKTSANASAQASDFIRQHAEMMKKKKAAEAASK